MNNLFIAIMMFFSSLAFTKAGQLFTVTESGAAISANMVLCLNAKGPLSCQNYHAFAENLSVRTTIKHSYPAAGVKVLTPGYLLTGCTYSSNGFCLFAASGESSNIIALKEATISFRSCSF